MIIRHKEKGELQNFVQSAPLDFSITTPVSNYMKRMNLTEARNEFICHENFKPK